MASLLTQIAKSVIVTGGGSGLGRVIATEFLRLGSSVAIVDVDGERLKTVGSELSAHKNLKTIKADINSKADVRTILKESASTFGQVDALINCAGIMDHFEGAGEHDPELWDKVMDVNLTAPFLLSREAIQEFLREGRDGGAKGGNIVNISMAGLRGGMCGASYASSKWGLLGLTKNTAALYATKGIRCNAICPSGMATNFTRRVENLKLGLAWGLVSKLGEVNPGFIDLEGLGRLVVFLCSEQGRSINGAVISADNGWNAI
ncbi:hypothetical protein ACJ41O_006433 [Fusarium nematophilum]